MFSIHISLFNGQVFTLPIPRNFLPKFVDFTGTINSEGLTFLSNEFYFLNQIRSGMIRCDDYKELFVLFAHKNVIREAISIKSTFATPEVKLKDCSKIFNHTHIGMNNSLTPEGIELVYKSQQFNQAWIHINNYNVVFNEYHEYCIAHVSQPPIHKPNGFGGFGVSTFGVPTFGVSTFGSVFGVPYQKTNQPKLAPLVPLCPPKGFFIEEPKDSEKINVSKLKSFTGGDTIDIKNMVETNPTNPQTPQKKHTADVELVCPGAPKKGRK